MQHKDAPLSPEKENGWPRTARQRLRKPLRGSRFNAWHPKSITPARACTLDMVDQQLDATSDFVRPRTRRRASASTCSITISEVGDLAPHLKRSAGELTPPGVATVRIVWREHRLRHAAAYNRRLFHIGGKLLSCARMQGRRKSHHHHFRTQAPLMEIADNGSGFLRDPVCQRLGSRAWSAVPQHPRDFQLETNG